MARLWLDVEDLFEYARSNPRPSGIQRVAFELYAALQEVDGGNGLIRFVRHDPVRNSFRDVPWSEVAAAFAGLKAKQSVQGVSPPPIRERAPATRALRRLVHRLPSPVRAALLDAVRGQAAALRGWGAVFAALVHAAPHRRRAGGARIPGEEDFADLVAPGDWLLALGASWSHPDYAALVRAQRVRHGLQFAMLIYDLIPLLRPEWCDRDLVRRFRAWCDNTFPLCAALFAISHATVADMTAYAAKRGMTLPDIVQLPMGLSLSREQTVPRRTARLPDPGRYALFVSTIEARKNHLLLFRVWQRLLREMPEKEVPSLVFAGRVGWLVGDLMHQIANTDWLNGKLVLIENPTDGELAALYEGCLFTLFPSLCEGWGLPVSESLAFGKPCLIADRSSLAEAGGDLVRRFDPDNLHDAYAAIRDTIEDRDALGRWEARIRHEFRPLRWSATAEALLRELRADRPRGEFSPLRAAPAVAAAVNSRIGDG